MSPPTPFPDTPMRVSVQPCALGPVPGVVLVAQTARGVCAILMGDDAPALQADLARRFPRARFLQASHGLHDLHGLQGQRVAQVLAFLAHPASAPEPPLDLHGTAFQQRVWRVLQAIPAGQTASYTEVAQRLGSPRAARAVAAACAANPVAVAVPCHRVVRRDGGLSGYRWGPERKRALLLREGVSLT